MSEHKISAEHLKPLDVFNARITVRDDKQQILMKESSIGQELILTACAVETDYVERFVYIDTIEIGRCWCWFGTTITKINERV